MKKWSFVLLLTILSQAITYAQQYNIAGKLTGFKENTRVDLLNDETESRLNTTFLKQGAFLLKGNLKEGPMYLTVTVHEGKQDYTCTVFAGAGDVTISGGKNDFPHDLKISGPAEQMKFNAYQQSLKPANLKSEALMQAYLKVQNDTAKARRAGIKYNAAGDEYHALNKKLIGQNVNTFYAAKAYYDYLPSMHLPTIQAIYNRFSVPIKQSIYGKRIQTYLTDGIPLKMGDKIYDFEAYDPAGNMHKLSSYTGKYILLDISSVHCGPCVESVDELRMLTTKYKSKLHIISFSPDTRADWLKGIKDDKPNWINLTDGKGLRGKTMLKYYTPGIPGFFIISPSGVIVETWTGYEKLNTSPGYLEKHLTKYLKKS